jgi:preprotein translocase subunit YajC
MGHLSIILYTVAIMAAFYFILLRPVLQAKKEQRMAVATLKIGDEVVTTGGLIGEIKDVVVRPGTPTELIIELAPGVRVRALTDAVSRRLTTLEPVPDGDKHRAGSTPAERAS